MKRQIRIIAWDDCAFATDAERVRLVGVIYRGADFPDGLLSTFVAKDGTDATDRIADAVSGSRHYGQLSYIMTDGITFAGLNVVDIEDLSKRTGMPVIAVQRKEPDIPRFKSTLKIFDDHKQRKEAVDKAGPLKRAGKMFYQSSGLPDEEAEQLLRATCVRSSIPEPLRVAHIIASGLSGESRGRA